MSCTSLSAPATLKSRATQLLLTNFLEKLQTHVRTSYTDHISTDIPVYMAAVLECITNEELEVAGNVVRDQGKTNITPRMLQLAVRND